MAISPCVMNQRYWDLRHARISVQSIFGKWMRRTVLLQDFTVLLPFVPVMRGGQDLGLARQVVHRLHRDVHYLDLESVLAFFASIVFDVETVRSLMGWTMLDLEKSVWYSEIIQKGLKQGLEQGLERARARARAGTNASRNAYLATPIWASAARPCRSAC